jgi:hypothetical protein
VWYCESCDFCTSDIDGAAEHASKTSDWVWLFPENPGSDAEALFEMHASDYDGVYLAQASGMTWHKMMRSASSRG